MYFTYLRNINEGTLKQIKIEFNYGGRPKHRAKTVRD